MADDDANGWSSVRGFLALERDMLVLSLAMFAFSLSFQMTGRYVPEYLRVLGAGAGVIGLYGNFGNLISAAYPYPADALALGLLFAFSGLRLAGLPAHKALIVGPAERGTGGRVTGTYYLVRNTAVIPSAALDGWLYTRDSTVAFALASAVGLVRTATSCSSGGSSRRTNRAGCNGQDSHRAARPWTGRMFLLHHRCAHLVLRRHHI